MHSKQRTTPLWRRPGTLATAAVALLLLGAAVVYRTWAWQNLSLLLASGSEPNASAQHEHTNHLIHETSPYLLQHAHNPVDWHPWGPEAFEKARKENKPIFLSVGYSTCHWCHVMERESFENEEIAGIINEHFVPVKVDREERPAVDEQYMLATRMMTGRGGWPNSVWLTPDLKPFMAGTYFPPEQFQRVLLQLADVWENRRDEILKQAERIAQAMQRSASTDRFVLGGGVNRELIGEAIGALQESFDRTRGGFGSAPKFPPHDTLRLLIHEYRRTEDSDLLKMIDRTLDGMARGGIRDHVGGGFHRYSTDGRWFLPHFEKMLYDNAQFLRNYADGYAVTGDERYRRVVSEIFEWLQRVMTHPEGGFYSALDSETGGVEGAYYVWKSSEVTEILGKKDGRLFADVYGFQTRGNFREEASGERTGANILHLLKSIDAYAREHNLDPQRLRSRLDEMREKLLAARLKRERPHLDDKVLTSWNGLMIAGLAHAGRTLDEPRYTRAAERAAEFVLDHLVRDGRLLRSFRDGEARQPGYLDDYAFLADGLLELYRATGNRTWLDESRTLADVMLADFRDTENGGFFFTSDRHDDLLMRSKNLLGGGNVPSGNGVAAHVLLRLGRWTGDQRYTSAAEKTLEALSGLMWQSPQGADALVFAAAGSLSPSQGGPAPSTAQLQPDARHEQSPVAAEAFASHRKVRPGGTFRLAVRLTIEDGWHLYGPNPEVDFVIPSTVALEETDAFQAGEVSAPQGQQIEDPVLEKTLNIYRETVWFRLPVHVAADAETGENTLELKLKTQACDENRCLPPRTATVELPIIVTEQADPEAIRHPALFSTEADGGR